MTDSWLSLQPIWEGGAEVIKQGLPRDKVSTGWQLILLGDGSPTRQLQILTNNSIEVDVIDMSSVGFDPDGAPSLIDLVPGPRLRRQVWLKTSSGQILAYATSWWAEDQVDNYLKNRSLSIWASMARSRVELYRDIRCIHYGACPELEKEFGEKGPFWGRYYLFWHQNKPLTLIYEVFSPYLNKYLGGAGL